jgi:hypothetical protein
MVKTILCVSVPLVVGVALGFGATSWEFSSKGDHFVESLMPGNYASTDSDDEGYAGGKLTVINGEAYDFGVTDQFTTGRHTFKVKNEGDQPLTIALLQTSCTCTSADMEEGKAVKLEPDEIKDITLEWEVKEYSGSFNQSAILRCSDPNRRVIRLTVKGRIHSLLSLSPETIVFPDLSNKEAATEFLRVYSYEHDDLQCEQVQQLKPELEKYFDVEVSPLNNDEIADVEDCKSGLFVQVTAKPGMPLGPFRQQVSLALNLESRASIDFEIEGNAVGNISVWTREKYSQRTQILNLGLIKRGTTKRAELQIFLKGKHKDTTVTLDQSSIDPSDVLKATLGEPIKIGDAARRFPLTIEVDAGNHTISRLARDGGNYGRIVLKTTHPDAPEIVIRVAFATGG